MDMRRDNNSDEEESEGETDPSKTPETKKGK
jgi:hypothetical protein